MDDDLALAIRRLRETGVGFVIVKGGHVLAQSDDHGILSLVAAAERLRAAGMTGAVLADRILGRSAVLVAVWARIRACHGETISEGALQEVQRQGLAFSYGQRVPLILNRSGTGMCPFEAAIRNVVHAGDAVVKLQAVRPGGGHTSSGGPAPGSPAPGSPAPGPATSPS